MTTRLRIAAILLACASLHVTADSLNCPTNPENVDLPFQMLESNIARGQGIGNSESLLAEIELGIFQQALRESIDSTKQASRKEKWEKYLQSSVSSMVISLSAVNTDTGIPLDRLSVGTSLIYGYRASGNQSYSSAISALQTSIILQQRNANGGLWYFDNRQNLTAYHNLSYLDGMFSYPSFAILAAQPDLSFPAPPPIAKQTFGLAAAVHQLQILSQICATPDGLLVHGYDASKAHPWANPVTGASPVVWGRSLAWYTLGVLNSLEITRTAIFSTDLAELRGLFSRLAEAQIVAAERSRDLTGNDGVWQVLDRPGESFSSHANFVEASASCMTVYSLLKGVRGGWIRDEGLRRRAETVAESIWQGVLRRFLIRNANGTLSLSGTSDIATLSGDVDYEYYVTRPTVLNSLIGTSAFVLAGLEIDKLCRS